MGLSKPMFARTSRRRSRVQLLPQARSAALSPGTAVKSRNVIALMTSRMAAALSSLRVRNGSMEGISLAVPVLGGAGRGWRPGPADGLALQVDVEQADIR